MITFLLISGLVFLFFVGLGVFTEIADRVAPDSLLAMMFAGVFWLFTFFYWLNYFGVIS